VSVVGNMFIVSYLKDAHSQVKVYQLDGSFVREVGLPGIGSASGFGVPTSLVRRALERAGGQAVSTGPCVLR
jgi:hypothetical protein